MFISLNPHIIVTDSIASVDVRMYMYRESFEGDVQAVIIVGPIPERSSVHVLGALGGGGGGAVTVCVQGAQSSLGIRTEWKCF